MDSQSVRVLTMTTYEINNRWTGAVLYTGGGKSLRDVVVAAVRGDADLRGAYLSRADLRDADLRGADLRDAYLRDAKMGDSALIGARPILQIGPIGSRSDYLVSHITEAGVMICAGCFFGTLDDFRAAVSETHGDAVHGREYAAALVMIEAHAALWSTDSEPT